MTKLEKYCKGLADINRLRILNLLVRGELCGCDIQYVLESPQPNVSRHLQYLKNAGLVLDRRDGYRVYYRLAEPFTGMRKNLFAFLQIAFQGEEPFRGDTKRLKEAIREGSCTLSEMSRSTSFIALHQTELARA